MNLNRHARQSCMVEDQVDNLSNNYEEVPKLSKAPFTIWSRVLRQSSDRVTLGALTFPCCLYINTLAGRNWDNSRRGECHEMPTTKAVRVAATEKKTFLTKVSNIIAVIDKTSSVYRMKAKIPKEEIFSLTNTTNYNKTIKFPIWK